MKAAVIGLKLGAVIQSMDLLWFSSRFFVGAAAALVVVVERHRRFFHLSLLVFMYVHM